MGMIRKGDRVTLSHTARLGRSDLTAHARKVMGTVERGGVHPTVLLDDIGPGGYREYRPFVADLVLHERPIQVGDWVVAAQALPCADDGLAARALSVGGRVESLTDTSEGRHVAFMVPTDGVRVRFVAKLDKVMHYDILNPREEPVTGAQVSPEADTGSDMRDAMHYAMQGLKPAIERGQAWVVKARDSVGDIPTVMPRFPEITVGDVRENARHLKALGRPYVVERCKHGLPTFEDCDSCERDFFSRSEHDGHAQVGSLTQQRKGEDYHAELTRLLAQNEEALSPSSVFHMTRTPALAEVVTRGQAIRRLRDGCMAWVTDKTIHSGSGWGPDCKNFVGPIEVATILRKAVTNSSGHIVELALVKAAG